MRVCVPTPTDSLRRGCSTELSWSSYATRAAAARRPGGLGAAREALWHVRFIYGPKQDLVQNRTLVDTTAPEIGRALLQTVAVLTSDAGQSVSKDIIFSSIKETRLGKRGRGGRAAHAPRINSLCNAHDTTRRPTQRTGVGNVHSGAAPYAPSADVW